MCNQVNGNKTEQREKESLHIQMETFLKVKILLNQTDY